MDNWRIKQLLDMYENDKRDEFVIYAIAQEHLKAGQLEASVVFFNKLLELNPEYVGLYYHLAHAYIELEQPDKAAETFKSGIDIATKLKDMHALGELKNAKVNFEMEL